MTYALIAIDSPNFANIIETHKSAEACLASYHRHIRNGGAASTHRPVEVDGKTGDRVRLSDVRDLEWPEEDGPTADDLEEMEQ